MKKTSALWLSVVLAASLLFSSCAKQGGQTASPAETTGTAAETTAGTSAAETTAASGAAETAAASAAETNPGKLRISR